MTRVFVDESLRNTLRTVGTRSEICDSAGQVLGYFWPADDKSAYKNVVVPATEEELDEAEREPGGRTLSEIMRRLEAR